MVPPVPAGIAPIAHVGVTVGASSRIALHTPASGAPALHVAVLPTPVSCGHADASDPRPSRCPPQAMNANAPRYAASTHRTRTPPRGLRSSIKPIEHRNPLAASSAATAPAGRRLDHPFLHEPGAMVVRAVPFMPSPLDCARRSSASAAE